MRNKPDHAASRRNQASNNLPVLSFALIHRKSGTAMDSSFPFLLRTPRQSRYGITFWYDLSIIAPKLRSLQYISHRLPLVLPCLDIGGEPAGSDLAWAIRPHSVSGISSITVHIHPELSSLQRWSLDLSDYHIRISGLA